MNRIKVKSEHIYTIVTLALAVVFCVLLWIHIDVNVRHYNVEMDADIASEAILSRDLYDNGFVTPDTWYASTANRIISAPNIAAFFYPVTGENMNLSMGIGCSVIMVLLFLFMFMYYKQIKFSWLEAFVAGILVLSLSDVKTENQSILFLWAAYYASHIITIYVISMIYNLVLKKKKIPIILWLVSIGLAVLNSMQGRHGSLFCYVPLLGVEILRRVCLLLCGKRNIFNNLQVVAWLVVTNIVAWFGSNVFGSYNMGASRNIRHAGEKFVDQVWPALGSVVNVKLMPILVWGVVACVVAGYVVTFAMLVKEKSFDAEDDCGGEGSYYLWSTLSHVASLVLWVLSGTFTTAEVAPRYFIIELFIVGVGASLFARKYGRYAGICVGVVVTVLGIMASRYYYRSLIVGDDYQNSDEYKVVCWMQDNGYEYGYATFDFANMITVYGNDSVKVRAVNSMSEVEGCKWLTDSDWYPPVKDASGETCYIVTEHTEPEFTIWMDENHVEALENTQVGKFTIYVLDHDYTLWER